MADLLPDGSIPITRAIGVPGGQQYDPTTGQPIPGTYTGYQARIPGSVPLGYADPMNATAGSTGLTYQGFREQQPRYYEGDQWSPATLGVADMIQLQQGLDAAGLYTGDYTLGVWDNADLAAYERLLAMSNAAGLDQKEMLGRTIANPKKKKGSGATRAPLVVKLSNRDDLKKTLSNVARDLYGADLPEADQERFVAAYQSLESGAQHAAYGMSGDTGGTIEAPPDPGVFAENQIKAEHPLEVRNQGFVNSMDQVLQTLTQRQPGGTIG